MFFSNKIMKMLIRAALEMLLYSYPQIVCEMMKTPCACLVSSVIIILPISTALVSLASKQDG